MVGVLLGYPIRGELAALGGRWNPRHKAWIMPTDQKLVAELKNLGVQITPAVLTALAEKEEVAGDLHTLKTAERPVPLAEMPVQATAFEHQIRAYNVALRTLFGYGEASCE